MVNAARDTAAEPRTQPKYGDGKYYRLWSMQLETLLLNPGLNPSMVTVSTTDYAAEPRTQPKYGDGKYYRLWSMQLETLLLNPGLNPSMVTVSTTDYGQCS